MPVFVGLAEDDGVAGSVSEALDDVKAADFVEDALEGETLVIHCVLV